MSYKGWIFFSGFVWFLIGAILLYKGLGFISEGRDRSDPAGQSGMGLIAIGLLIGFFKGRFVLVKTVRRVVLRIVSLPLPIRIKDVYAPGYYLLIFGMMGLGLLFRFLPLPIEIRGTIDVAIGSALINGALLYFRAARIYDKNSLVQSQSLDKAAQQEAVESSDA